ncbi:MAG: Ig-like domain-containing protein, partial [Patescibacteria group bacterium]|nr:Ig-like domain-containing protein [Patescibacteria group bacterium]
VGDADTPAAPVIGHIATDEYINNAEKAAIIVTGTAEANSLVTVTLTNGANSKTEIWQLTDDATEFSISVDGRTATPGALADGIITASVTATDAAGNVSAAATDTAIQDTGIPDAPVIEHIAGDELINDSEKAAIIVTGTAEAGSLVTVTLSDGENSKTGTQQLADDATAFSITIDGTDAAPLALTDGTITPSVTATDAAGNVSAADTDPTATQDISAPTATAAVTPSTGTLKVGDIVTTTLTAGGSQADLTIGACTVNSIDVAPTFINNTDGTYTVTYTVAEDNDNWVSGALPISCVLNEPSGNSVTVSDFDGNTLVGDADTPAAPVIGHIATDEYINNAEKAAIIVTGTAEANSLVTATLAYGENSKTGTQQLTEGATAFSITIDGTTATPEALADGIITASVTATDAAGNKSAADIATATQDTSAPTLPTTAIIGTSIQDGPDTITLVFNDTNAVSAVDSDWTDCNEIALINSPDGTAKTLAGATCVYTPATKTLVITLAEDATNVATYLVNGSAVEVTPALNKIQDEAGNMVANSEVISDETVSGDDDAPVLSSIVYNQVGGGVITYVNPYAQVLITATFNEDMTSSPTITIAAPGTLADVTAQTMSRTSATVWTYTWTVPNDLTVEGLANISFAGTDLAGISYVDLGNPIAIDSHTPIVNTFTAESITTTGATLTVTTNENATCAYANTEKDYDNMTTMEDTGAMTHIQVLTGLTANTLYNYYVRCQDSSGNIMTNSAHVSFSTLGDEIAPTAPVITTAAATVNADYYTISGTVTSDSNSTQVVKVFAGTEVYGTVIVPKSGTAWSVAVSLPQSATTTFRANSTDESGNVSEYSNSVIITESATAGQGNGSLAVTSINSIESYAAVDGGWPDGDASTSDGWSWTFYVTVPTNETLFNMKFDDWQSNSHTIDAGGNMRFYSSQASSDDPINIVTAGTYSEDMTITGDLDPETAGNQIAVTVEMKIPSGSSGGSYSTSYGIKSR